MLTAKRSTVPEFKSALVGRTFEAHVIDVYDGDTCTAVFNPWPLDPESKKWQFKIRLLHYNAPELKQRTTEPDRKELKEKALDAKNALSDLILDKNVVLECSHFDDFGRILSEVYINGVHINQEMLDAGHGVPFEK